MATTGFPNLFARFNSDGLGSNNLTSDYEITRWFIVQIIAHATKESNWPENLIIRAYKKSKKSGQAKR